MNLEHFNKKYGKWALVTGASSGIGAEYARQLAIKGINLVLVARSSEKLIKLADELRDECAISIRTISANLTLSNDIEEIFYATQDLDIGLLVNNAGREDSGYFLETSVDQAINTIDLNVKAPLQLSHYFGGMMAGRGKGGIIFMSSIVAFQGVPLISNYAATKAYDLIFSESLAAELRPLGVDILAVAPGFTKTNLSPDFNFQGLPFEPMDPQKVVKNALQSLGRRRVSIPGFINKFLFVSGKLQPRVLNTWSFGLVFKRVLRDKINRTHNDVYTTI